jgi:uncharacterized protein (TIGR03790 family)
MLVCALSGLCLAEGDWRPASTLVIANKAVPAGVEVARYYMEKRHVPEANLLLLETTSDIGLTRVRYSREIEEPVRAWLQARGALGAKRLRQGAPNILYIVLCYGVPTTVWEETPQGTSAATAWERNRASVDGELAALFFDEAPETLVRNPYFGQSAHPRDAVQFPLFLVTRLDGPTPEIARGLVDSALAAERLGVQGVGYFDTQGITQGSYRAGDLWIEQAERAVWQAGYPVVEDRQRGLLAPPGGFYAPAFYFGWYTEQPYGPFKDGQVRFVPGAFAYHLHSGSAVDLRQADTYWVGPLLAAGATCTMGTVQEPLLQGTPQVGIFVERMLAGFDFGESAYMACPLLSWQMLFVGDPLYRPFAPDLKASQAEALKAERPDDLRWLDVRAVNALRRDGHAKEAELLAGKLLDARPSALVAEALLSVLLEERRISQALLWVERVKDFPGPVEERSQLLFTAAEVLTRAGKDSKAQALYQRLAREFPGTSGAARAAALQPEPHTSPPPAGTAPVGREGAP